MGYYPPEMSIFAAPVTFCLPNLSADSPPAGRAGQESNQSRKFTGAQCLPVGRQASTRKASPPLGGQRTLRFLSGWCCALLLIR